MTRVNNIHVFNFIRLKTRLHITSLSETRKQEVEVLSQQVGYLIKKMEYIGCKTPNKNKWHKTTHKFTTDDP